MKVAVIGAGAVGLALGSCLLQAGCRVRFVARPRTAEALRARGLSRTGIFGDFHAAPDEFGVDHDLAALAGGELDVVLVCTKAFTSVEVAAELGAVWNEIGPEPFVVIAHNGWGSAEVFASSLPRERVYSARVITGFRRPDPATSDVTVHAEAVHLGSLFGADPAPLAPLARAISEGGLPCAVSDEIERDLWAKVLYNCALNPLGALYGVPYGVLGREPATRAILESAVREVFGVLAAAEHETHWASAADYLREFYADILPPTERHESSMLQDLRAGRRTEIDALCGAVTALGRKHGVETPVNAALADLIRAAEARAND